MKTTTAVIKINYVLKKYDISISKQKLEQFTRDDFISFLEDEAVFELLYELIGDTDISPDDVGKLLDIIFDYYNVDRSIENGW